MRREGWAWTIALAAAAFPAWGADPSSTDLPEAARRAVEKAVPLIETAMKGYVAHRDCFSCHHQAVPLLALTSCKERGIAVDEAGLKEQRAFIAERLERGAKGYRQGFGQGGGVITAGYALWALEAVGQPPDETTGAVAEFFLKRQEKTGFWRASSRRPPSEISHFTATFLALRGLTAFGTEEQARRLEARKDQVRAWLEETPAEDTEDRVFRLWGLKAVGAGEATIAEAVRQLVESQRDDGGWAQTSDRESDSYATGSVLVALQRAGGLPVTDPAYRKGLLYLVRNQEADGSWHVVSRSRPFQTYFETGFPHGKDQFISMAATSWATAALALACPRP